MSDTPTLTFEVLVEHDEWGEIEPLVEKCFASVMTKRPEGIRSGVISLLFSGDGVMQQLNNAWRSKDAPTNVLSFPAGPGLPGLPDGEDTIIGDIALGYETCFRESVEKGIGVRDHTAHLIVHGMLHLFGYDHLTESEAEEMERLETYILASMGIADPYMEKE